ncbi:polycomb group protein ASXL1 isoform X1 [Pogona vitticeps]
MKEMKQRRKKERTWAEAARLVLENYSDGPMTPKQILQVIETEGLKEMSGTSPLACLNAMLHSNSRSCDGLFHKLPGRISLFTLKKDAVPWSRNLSAPEGEDLDDTVDAESSGSNEAASTVSGDNDVSLDETSSNASCSTEPQSKSGSAVRESNRAVSQASKQKKKAGVMLPRVVLTPLKVNGAHMETSSGFPGRQAGGEGGGSSSSSSSSALCGSSLRSRTEMARDPPQLFRGLRKTSGGQMKRNRGDDIDFETPGSILVNTNLRALINLRTFNALPLPFQQQLLLLLPEVDRQTGADGLLRLSGSALNNEFFALAAQSWRERLADGEFTHEMQVRIRQEMEKEKKTEQWKERFFEDYYGQKLGLTREEPVEQNSAPRDTEKESTSASQEEPTRVSHGPITRQRDGHFRKRSLRSRTRRSLYKLREAEQAEAATEVPPPVEPESAELRDPQPEAGLCIGSQASSPKREISSEATRVPSKAEEAVAVAVAERIPSLPQELQDQESKEQKRKSFEQAASPSFPEKKPRLEDRQSFRNTIESVHPEKPQPTKEEPKVPPIRIQLSRIKPPWVVKGQPAYQICPRIIPNPEPSGQDGRGAPAPADFKACALQGGRQREAVAPAAAIGGGGGPGGGGGRSTDKGGGSGGRGGGGGRVRPRGPRPKYWRTKRTRGKRVPHLQRAQLLPPSCLAEKTSWELVEISSPRAVEGDLVLGPAADLASSGSEGASQPAEASEGGSVVSPGAKLPLGFVAPETPVSGAGHLLGDVSSEPSPAVPSQESDSDRERNGLLRDGGDVESLEDDKPVVVNCISFVDETAASPSYPGALALENGKNPSVDGSGSGEQGPGSVLQDLTQSSHASPRQLPAPCHGRAALSRLQGSDLEKPLGGLNASHGRCTLESSLPSWEKLLKTGGMAAGQQAGTGPVPFSDEETRSVGSETTETASDLEPELTDDSAELNDSKAVAEEAGPCSDRLEESSEMRPGRSPPAEVLPPEEEVSLAHWPPDWRTQPPLPQKACGTSPPGIDLESQERPVVAAVAAVAPKALSVEASNPLVVQLLKGSLPLRSVLPGAQSSSKAISGSSSLEEPATERSFPVGNENGGGLSQKTRQDEGLGMNGTVRNGYCMPGSFKGSITSQGTVGRLEKEAEGSKKSLKFRPSPSTPDQGASTSPETYKLPEALRGRALPSGACEAEEEASVAAPAGSATGQGQEAKRQATPAPTPFPPGGKPPASPDPQRAGSVCPAQGVQGKKVFGPSGLCSAAQRLHHHKGLEPFPMLSMLSHSKPGPPAAKSTALLAEGRRPVKEEWPPRVTVGGGGGVENRGILAGPVSARRKEARPGPAERVEQLPPPLHSLPLAKDLPFFKLPREPGRGLPQPLEPSSIPSQLNIKQAFYGKLSKLQLNPASLNYASHAPAFSRSLVGTMMPLGPKAGSRGVSLSAQMFADSSNLEEISLKCSCSLKAMIMCKGCGAFCHDDCIGPSKLCVLCLVVR